MRTKTAGLTTVLAVSSLALATLSWAQAPPTTFLVDSTGDTGDTNPGDGICDDGTGSCTLRAAIQESQLEAGTNSIFFDIAGPGPHTIAPGAPLPPVTDPVVIDATTQPGYASTPIIELDGSAAGSGVDGLQITAGNSTVRGLVINRFGDDGIHMQSNGGNTIEGCFIGTDVSGTADLGNTHYGIHIENSPNNTIGGTDPGARNISSGNGFSGVALHGANSTGNVVQGNYLGTDITGTVALGNAYFGVYMVDAPGNTIGGTTAAARNLISGNHRHGITVSGGGSTGNVIQGNYIGTDVTGSADLGNTLHGIDITGAGDNLIGGADPGAGNLLSANAWSGVHLSGSGATGNRVMGNRIGTGVGGTEVLGNGYWGVYIAGASGSTIGGLLEGSGNVITHNARDGVWVAGGTGNAILSNAIHDNGELGIDLGADGVTVNDGDDGDTGPNGYQNYPVVTVIDPASNTVLVTLNSTANTTFRVELFANDMPDPTGFGEGQVFLAAIDVTTDFSGQAVSSVTLSTDISAGDLICATATDPDGNTSEFSGPEVLFTVTNPNDSGAGSLRQTLLQANAMPGTDTITFDIPGPGPHTIQLASALPVITDPVTIDGTTQPGFAGSPIIELDGSNAGSGVDGLQITAGSSTVRGLVINRFGDDGIHLQSNGANTVEGCFIGTDVSGTVDLGNVHYGIFVDNSPDNTVGGTDPAVRNLLSGNGFSGVALYRANATRNVVQGNYVGTDVTGTLDLGNTWYGVYVRQTADNKIGGTGEGEGNLIAHNVRHGVNIESTSPGNEVVGNTISENGWDGVYVQAATGNAILSNSISGNGGLGIDLGPNGVTANDDGDGDTGANGLQNHPQLTDVDPVGDTVTGVLNSTANTTFRLQFFASRGTDPTVFGEGETYIGSTEVTTDGNGDADFTVAIPVGIDQTDYVSATATDPDGNTSEYSACWTDGMLTVLNTNDSGWGSLRQALHFANALPGLDAIDFSIGSGVQTISLLSALPPISDPVIIDGTTQPGFAGSPIIELDGSGAGSGVDGLQIAGGNSTVRGLVINRFGDDGIHMQSNGGNTIEGCFIGTDVSGTVDLGNVHFAINVDKSPDNIIGGTAPGARNLLSGNGYSGVRLYASGATRNVVQGNYVGTDITGTQDLGNTWYGVYVRQAPGNTIGGISEGEGNLVSGNDRHGINIEASGASGNLVVGNSVGTNAAGDAALGNGRDGINISADNNTIGGMAEGAGNLISANAQNGVLVRSGVTGTLLQGNHIGTDASGTKVLGNGQHGVHIAPAANTTVGGTAESARNLISGNGLSGVAASGATGTLVQGNYVGTDITGTVDLGNAHYGVDFYNSSDNTVGGTDPGAANVLSGNGFSGVRMQGGSATGNVIQGNFLGTDVSGTLDLGNTWYGAYISSASGNTVGGLEEGAANLVAFNDKHGVRIEGSSVGNEVVGNTITANTWDGVQVNSGTGNTVRMNSIHGNGDLGIDLGPEGVTANDIGDGDTGANGLQNYPVLTAVDPESNTVMGTLNSAASTTLQVEFFSSNSGDPSGYGEGETYLGSTEVATDGSGDATFSVGLPIPISQGSFVSATATDADGNTSEFSRSLELAEDENQPPVADAGRDTTVACTCADGATVMLDGSGSSDPDGDGLILAWTAEGIVFDDAASPSPTAVFPLGATTVTLTVTDPQGAEDADDVVVTVVDATAPEISVVVAPAQLWPPNHKMADITATVTVSDACDDAPVVVLSSIESDEPDDGLGDGDHPDDIQDAEYGTADYAFRLRAERSGSGDGREYTVTYTVTDATGNSASGVAVVAVPHDRGKGRRKEVVVAETPTDYALGANAPNPFNAATTIRFDLPVAAGARLEILDVLGRRIRVLVNGYFAAGSHQVTWDGRDAAGRSVSSGIYLCRLHAGEFHAVRKMLLLQ